MTKPLRQTMPYTAALIDELREVFGAEMINAAIRAGLDGQPTFYAKENGQEIGTACICPPECSIALSECQIGPFNPANAVPATQKGKRHG